MIKPYYKLKDKNFYLIKGDTMELLPKINHKFDKSSSNKLKPKILFDKKDKTNKKLLRKYLPTITTKERIVKNTRLNEN